MLLGVEGFSLRVGIHPTPRWTARWTGMGSGRCQSSRAVDKVSGIGATCPGGDTGTGTPQGHTARAHRTAHRRAAGDATESGTCRPRTGSWNRYRRIGTGSWDRTGTRFAGGVDGGPRRRSHDPPGRAVDRKEGVPSPARVVRAGCSRAEGAGRLRLSDPAVRATAGDVTFLGDVLWGRALRTCFGAGTAERFVRGVAVSGTERSSETCGSWVACS